MHADDPGLLQIALCLAFSSVLAVQGVSLPTTQSFINYILLAAVYGSILVYSKRPLQNAWYKYAALAVLDVEANYLLITAYRFTSITSVTLLDCFTIPGENAMRFAGPMVVHQQKHVAALRWCTAESDWGQAGIAS